MMLGYNEEEGGWWHRGTFCVAAIGGWKDWGEAWGREAGETTDCSPFVYFIPSPGKRYSDHLCILDSNL